MKAIFVIAIATMALYSCGSKSGNSTPEDNTAEEAAPQRIYSAEEQDIIDSFTSMLTPDGTGIGKYHIGDTPAKHLPYASMEYGSKYAILDSAEITSKHFKIVESFAIFNNNISDSIVCYKMIPNVWGHEMPHPVLNVSDKSQINRIECFVRTDPHVVTDTIAVRFEDVLRDKGYVLKRKKGIRGADGAFIQMEKGDTVATIHALRGQDIIKFTIRMHYNDRIYVWGNNKADNSGVLNLNDFDSIPRAECNARFIR